MLQSLRASTSLDFDTVVVDNASTDGSPEMLQNDFPWVHVVRNAENLGGTGGFNTGIRYGVEHPNKYDYLWLLDNDVVVKPGALDGLLAPMEKDPGVGIVGSAVLLLDDPGHVQEVGVLLNWRTGGPERMAEGPAANLKPGATFEVDYVAACSLLARTEAVRQVGLWDANYFLMWDDMEWGVRFNRAGWKVLASADSRVEHESYDQRRALSVIASTYTWNRNAYYFLRRYAPKAYLPLVMFHRFRVELAMADNYQADGRVLEARALRQAIRDFFAGKMGKPDAQWYKRSDKPDPWKSLSNEKRNSVKRVALFACDNPELTRQMYSLLCQEFPQAEVDTLLLATRQEILRESFQRARRASALSLTDRLKLGMTIATKYDAVAGISSMPRRYFEKFVKYNLRIDTDMTWQVKRRNLGELVELGWRRVLVLGQAGVLTIRALFKRMPEPDYFSFKR